MLSPGGKIEWKCPYCYHKGIKKVRVHPTMAALMRDNYNSWTEKEWEEGMSMTVDHGECPNCNSWFHWTARIKQPTKNKPCNYPYKAV